MSNEYAIVLVLAALIFALATWRGGQPERWSAIIIVVGIVVDRLILWSVGDRPFNHFDLSRLVIDWVQMGLFLIIALRANRLYPLGITAAQLIAILGSFSVLLVPHGWNYAYWAMTQLPLFIQLILLATGTIAHWRRVLRIGEYNGWSPQFVGGEIRQ